MNFPTPPLEDALRQSDLLHDRAELDRAIARMAAEIRADYSGQRPLFLTMMNGGMIFASLLSLELGIDCEFDYLHATRYRGATQGSGLQWLRRPSAALAGRQVLLVDDILDEGPTLHAVREWCRDQGAAQVRMAVLAWKRHGRCLPGLDPDYVGIEVPDRYVFGFGMDYYEQGRNLPAIYALK
jgi:hypoxanthine phosphoribosyltransferase